MRPSLGKAALALAPILLCAACGTAAAPAGPPAAAPGPTSMSLATSLTTSQGTWTSVPMGAASGENEFWQLFFLPNGLEKWVLATPPNVASNGSPALAAAPGPALVVGVRPSLYLAFSPISQTKDEGRTWTAGPPATGLASVPDALGAGTGKGELLALSRGGQVSLAGSSGKWSALTSERQLAASEPGRRCGLDGLTAIAFAGSTPVIGGNCRRPGESGIFAQHDGRWESVGPALPAAVTGLAVKVLRLQGTSEGLTAILQAGHGSATRLVAAWQDQRGRWTQADPLSTAGQGVTGTALGAAGAAAVVLSGDRADVITGPGAAWRQTPPLPAARATALALPDGGPITVLAATRGDLTVWQLGRGSAGWARKQLIKVPIQYGSSG